MLLLLCCSLHNKTGEMAMHMALRFRLSASRITGHPAPTIYRDRGCGRGGREPGAEGVAERCAVAGSHVREHRPLHLAAV